MRQLNMEELYRGKYVSLPKCDGEITFSNDESQVFRYDSVLLARHITAYANLLNMALN